jgi:hypothetical protein
MRDPFMKEQFLDMAKKWRDMADHWRPPGVLASFDPEWPVLNL